jgi:predicted DNA-binding transcriptional regulator AlpA
MQSLSLLISPEPSTSISSWTQGMSKASESRFITLDELCALIGLSKATYYKHQRNGVFPAPLKTSGGRLVFDQKLVEQCQQIVRTRTGLNGEPVIFSSRKKKGSEAIPKRPHNAGAKHDDMISALASLGVTATAEEIERTSKDLQAGLSEPELIRQLFLALRKQS